MACVGESEEAKSSTMKVTVVDSMPTNILHSYLNELINDRLIILSSAIQHAMPRKLAEGVERVCFNRGFPSAYCASSDIQRKTKNSFFSTYIWLSIFKDLRIKII